MNKIKNRIITEIERIQSVQEGDNEGVEEKGNIFDNIFENNSFETSKIIYCLLMKQKI